MHTTDVENLPFVSRSVVDLALLQAISELDKEVTDDAMFGSRVRGVIAAHRSVANSPTLDTTTQALMDFAEDSARNSNSQNGGANGAQPEAAAAPAQKKTAKKAAKKKTAKAPTKKAKATKTKAAKTKKGAGKTKAAKTKAAPKAKAAKKKGRQKKTAGGSSSKNGSASAADEGKPQKPSVPVPERSATVARYENPHPGPKAYTEEQRAELRGILMDKIARMSEQEADTSQSAIVDTLDGWRKLPKWLKDRELSRAGLLTVVRKELDVLVEEGKLRVEKEDGDPNTRSRPIRFVIVDNEG